MDFMPSTSGTAVTCVPQCPGGPPAGLVPSCPQHRPPHRQPCIGFLPSPDLFLHSQIVLPRATSQRNHLQPNLGLRVSPKGNSKARNARVTPTFSPSPAAAGFICAGGTQSWNKSITCSCLGGHSQKTRNGVREEQTIFRIVLIKSLISSPWILAGICFQLFGAWREGPSHLRAFACAGPATWMFPLTYPQVQRLYLVQVSARISSQQRGISDHIILNLPPFPFILLSL